MQVPGEPYESPCARDAENLPSPHSGRYLHLQVLGIPLKGLGSKLNQYISPNLYFGAALFLGKINTKFLLSFMKTEAALEFLFKLAFFLIGTFLPKSNRVRQA